MADKSCESGSCSLPQEKIDFIKMSKTSRATAGATAVLDAGVKQNVSGIKIKIFGKKDCSICKSSTEKINSYKANIKNQPAVIYYDMDTLDGLTEAAIYTAFDVPTIVVEKDGHELKRWKAAPSEEEMNNACSGLS
ncbi:MAG: hypothetical protein PHE88_05255 [Elusimicrobia bacterium]|nr:hypothetical protein [Elusimicrobiota bacterium]